MLLEQMSHDDKRIKRNASIINRQEMEVAVSNMIPLHATDGH
jgi:hypothetical protein